MDQQIVALEGEDLAHLERQRGWVRGHYDDTARHHYETVDGKLKLLQVILDSDWISSGETWKLQSLGVAFGDTLHRHLGLEWVTVIDTYGRDPALRDPHPTVLIFALTTISKRIEAGEKVLVALLFEQACQLIEQHRQNRMLH